MNQTEQLPNAKTNTNNQLQQFNFNNQNIHVAVDTNNEVWFIGKEVCELLGTETRDLRKILDNDEISNLDTIHIGGISTIIDQSNGGRAPLIVSEAGLYKLIMRSRKDNAKPFQRWVTHEVLPSIRKHGAYMTEQTIEQALTSPDFLIKLANQLKDEQAKRIKAENHAKALEPKARFADAVVNSKTNILVNDLAKILKSNGVNIGGYRLFAWLRDNGYLIKRKGTDYNMPTQKSMELGLFVVKETPVFHHDGHTTVSKTPKVTGKGQEYFVNKFLKQSEALMKQTLGQSSQPQSKVLEVK